MGGVDPIGHFFFFFSRLLKFCYAIRFSEEQGRLHVYPDQVKAGFTVTMQGCCSWNFGHEGQAVSGLVLHMARQ